MKRTLAGLKKRIGQILKDNKEHEKALAFYSQFIHKGDLCFDIGAHIGNRTKIFLDLGARVVAVEPQRSCIDHLQKKFKNEPKLNLVNKGLSDKEGELTLYISESATTISTFSDKWKSGRFSSYSWNKSTIVPVTTLDKMIEEFGMPNFCKIDVEGFEFQVIRGLSRPIPIISFEFTKEFLSDAKSCIDYLQSLGYSEFNVSVAESMQVLFDKEVTPEELLNELKLIDDDLLWGDILARNK